MASAITAVAHPSGLQTPEIVHALAIRDFSEANPSSFILRVSARGDLLNDPIRVPLPAFAGIGDAGLAHSSLLFDGADRIISVFGH